VKWVREVNSRWIVHDGLDAAAGDYLDHLAAVDPGRLERSCRMARAMVKQGAAGEDPKPRFYGGLFSLCTPEEAKRFLAGHLFLALLQPGVDESQAAMLSEATARKLRALREELRVKTQNQS